MKKFVDSNLFKGEWVSSLTPNQKLLWVYLISEADCAGIVISTNSVISAVLGVKIKESDVMALRPKVVELRAGVFLLTTYLKNQYRYIKDSSNIAIGITRSLGRFGVFVDLEKFTYNFKDVDTLTRGYVKGLPRPQDKDKDKDQDQDQDQDQEDDLVQKVVDRWNTLVEKVGKGFSKVSKITPGRKAEINKALDEFPNFDDWEKIIHQVAQDGFRCGENQRGWVASFDWIFQNKNGTTVKNYIRLFEEYEASDQQGVENAGRNDEPRGHEGDARRSLLDGFSK